MSGNAPAPHFLEKMKHKTMNPKKFIESQKSKAKQFLSTEAARTLRDKITVLEQASIAFTEIEARLSHGAETSTEKNRLENLASLASSGKFDFSRVQREKIIYEAFQELESVADSTIPAIFPVTEFCLSLAYEERQKAIETISAMLAGIADQQEINFFASTTYQVKKINRQILLLREPVIGNPKHISVRNAAQRKIEFLQNCAECGTILQAFDSETKAGAAAPQDD